MAGGCALAPLIRPNVLLTRPRVASEAFLSGLQRTQKAFLPLISPAFEIAPVQAEIPDFDAAVFTSVAAVDHAPRGDGRVAWCVGDVTAKAAATLGYDTHSAQGAAEELVGLILDANPSGRLLYFRGESSAGKVTQRLRDAGLDCAEVVVYRKDVRLPTREVIQTLGNDAPLLIPAFSAETVTILAGWMLPTKGCTVVAISEKVAQSSQVLRPSNTVLSSAPNLVEMTAATAALIA